MPNPPVITITFRHGGTHTFYAKRTGDGYTYFDNGRNFYRIHEGRHEAYILNSLKNSWMRTDIFEGYDVTGINDGSGSIATNDAVENATQWAIDISRDFTHGYNQWTEALGWNARWGTPDYDCSALVYSAFHQAGFDVPVNNGATSYTGTMVRDFTNVGFTWYPGMGNSSSDLRRGDILLNIQEHTEIYIGDGLNVGAQINELGGIYNGEPGDQTGVEICVLAYRSYPWHGILRYNG